MPNIEKSPATQVPTSYTVSLKFLGGLLISYLLGLASHLLARNFFSGQPLTFSTPELINFVLSVLLSGASIFLAIAAIALGRFSEQAIIDRSDESIRLQNEVFQKTTDALQRIESSTGVTEKRIEDIISGRVGDLSQRAARIATEAPSGKDMEEVIRKSLYEALREEGVLPRQRYLREFGSLTEADERRREEYNRSSKTFLQALSNRPELKLVKIGRGQADASGDDIFDGIFLRKDGTRLGIVDFAPLHSRSLISRGLYSAIKELQNGNVGRIFVVFYGPKEEIEPIFNETVSLISSDLKRKISLIVCPPEHIAKIANTLPIEG
ncbi:MAG TPA: hypothetical protein VEF05_16345 [Terriglobales bacterium]|nr:hypothetical protein [Terriglobales bacterium]